MYQPKYHHYIVTRFNVKNNDLDKNENITFLINENWLKQRFQLFETYCLPSVAGQTCRDFKWLVYFDTNTPENYKDLIASYSKIFSGFLPKFIPDMTHLTSSIKAAISEELNDAGLNNIVITTRLDNDDLLHENFVQTVRFYVEKNRILNGIVDIPNGYCLQIKPSSILSKTTQFSNAFITYIEPYKFSEKLLTVMDRPHYEWAYSVKTYFIYKARLWMQMIHGQNAMNKFRGTIVNDELPLPFFNVHTKINFCKRKIHQAIFDILIRAPFFFIKAQVQRIMIKQHNEIKH